MFLRQSRSSRPYTHFPYTTLFRSVSCTLLYIGPGQRLPDELPSRCVALNDGEASARQIAVRGGTVGYGYNRNSMAICVPADLCASDLQIGFAVARLHAGN